MRPIAVPLVLVLVLAGSAQAGDEPPPSTEPTAWEVARARGALEDVELLGRLYRQFLSDAKTEREVVRWAHQAFSSPEGGVEVFVNRDRAAILARRGKRPLADGFKLIASHVDSPRIDLKPRPLYAAFGFALLDTHYYGWIKSRQWLSTPLALHGVVVKKDGTKVEVTIGEESTDPVFCIPDVLPHLEGGAKALENEMLDPLAASVTLGTEGDVDGRAAKALADALAARGIEVDDLVSADLSLVPAGPARKVGLDEGLVGGYGQDDRLSAFASLHALAELDAPPERWAVVFLADKEEIGSQGNTSAQSTFLWGTIATLLERELGPEKFDENAVRACFERSAALSTDATAGVSPHHPEIHDLRHAAYLGRGVAIDRSGEHAEFVASVIRRLDEAKVPWQPAIFGRADTPRDRGSTILPYLTRLGMDGMDLSVAVLGMHSPFEVSSAVDLWCLVEAEKAWWASE